VTPPDLSALLTRWAPEPAELTETMTAEPVVALARVFDVEPPGTEPGDPVPPLWHWLYFLERPAQRDLGPDGHPAAGGFLPPIPRRRRMYAGGRVSYLAPIRLGDQLTRRSELAGWKIRPGRTGGLLFVTVRHSYTRGGDLMATEEQDLVYRSAAPDAPKGAGPGRPPAAAAPARTTPTRPPAGAPPDPAGSWRLEVAADPVLLFRFSALTFNAHRIHYDAEYARTVEGYPGLVVHGPLLALLCLELPRRQLPGRPVSQLSFRARSPLYAGQTLTFSGSEQDGGCQLRVTAPDGTDAMTAEARLGP
jgi:hydroxyacyl-ACP dehydratase HTD2-like protein with hotdog domain